LDAAEREGEIEVAGPDLAQSLGALGLIDEFRISLSASCWVTASSVSLVRARRFAS